MVSTELLRLLGFLAFGALIGLVVSVGQAGRRWASGSVGIFAAAISYAFSTSVWAYRAVASRVPGISAPDWQDRVLYVLFDHPVLCAIGVSAVVCLVVRGTVGIIKICACEL